MNSIVFLVLLSVVGVKNSRVVCHKGLCSMVRENDGSKTVVSGQQCFFDEECNKDETV